MRPDLSPGVERAEAAATRRADAQPTAADWLLALLDDDEAKPAGLVVALGAELDAVRASLRQLVAAPVSPADLYAVARRKGLLLRSDGTVTTDLVLLACLELGEPLAGHGVTAAAVEGLLAVAAPAGAEEGFGAAEFHVAEPTELVQAARVVDVNANRARESLRVLDDYCRFVLNDALLTGEVKRLRHDLVAAVGALPAGPLLAARDTPHDVGTAVGVPSEYRRSTPAQVARVNVARLQESLRSLEEFGKVLDESFARRVESLRYAAYTLDRALFGRTPGDRLREAQLYALLTGSQCVASLEWTIAEAAAGGVQVVQLREKAMPDRELLARAKDVRRWATAAGVLFVVNDRPDIAALCGADGVHLGQDDLDVAEARRVVGPNALVGVSTHTAEQVRRAVIDDGADYVGVGPTFPSKTKSFADYPGLDFVREVASLTSLPAFALGGVDLTNVSGVVAAGLRRVAVSSALATADDPKAVARRFRAALGELTPVQV